MDYLEEVGPNKLMLCGGKRCCPTIELGEDGIVEIVDDFGGKVRMNVEQAELITQALVQLSEK
jgi:hypothetical protein